MKYEAKLIASSIILAGGIIGLSMPEAANGYEAIGVIAILFGTILLIISWAEIDLTKLSNFFFGDKKEGNEPKPSIFTRIKNYDKLENRMAKEEEEKPKS